MNAAYRLIAKHGYDATSMNMIAKKANISKGALYHHFESKEQLLVRVFKDLALKPYVEALSISEKVTRENYKEILMASGLEYIRAIGSDPVSKKFHIQIFGTAMKIPGIMEMFTPLYESTMKSIVTHIHKGIEFGFLPEDTDIELTSQKIFMYMDMLVLYASMDFPMRLTDMWTEMIHSLFINEK